MKKIDEKQRLFEITSFERPFWEKGVTVGGVDEVGRGPLAGPVITACVILPPDELIEGINDSKKLSEKKREKLNELILQKAVRFAYGFAGEEEIDRINIRQATLKAMASAIEQVKPEHVLIDCEKVPTDIPQTSIVHGDAMSYLIGAASIIAKVYRDDMMVKLSKLYPEYGFERNKGYGTKAHIEAIKKYGLCPAHRRSFTSHFVDK